jgi:hypothetical protein
MSVAQINEEHSEIDRRGLEIYDSRLKSLLEPEQNGKAVAIHVDTEDYIVHENWALATRLMRERHPDGAIFTLFIGPPMESEIMLANRLNVGRKP